MGNDSSKMAEEIAELRKEMRAERRAQRKKEKMSTGSLIPTYSSPPRMVPRSLESIYSDVSLKSDWSKDNPINFKDRNFPRLHDLIGPDMDPVGDHDNLMNMRSFSSASSSPPRRVVRIRRLRMEMMAEEMAQREKKRRAEEMARLRMEMMAEEIAELRKDMMAEREAQRNKEKRAEEMAQLLMKMMTTGSMKSIDSGLSFKTYRSKAEPINFKDRDSPRLGFFGLGVPAVEDFNKRWDDLRATGSLESIDSGVSLKSDQSKAGLIDFKDRVSPRPDFSSSEEEDVSDDEDLVESPDDQMVKRSMMSIDSGVSVKSDGSKAEPIDFKEGVSPRDEMNQELSSEVARKHG